MDRRLLAGLKARAPSLTAHMTALETCSLCVCSALRKRMASLSCCISPTPGGWESSGGGRGHCIKKCFIRRSKFCTIGLQLLFCIVCVCVCVGFLSPIPPKKLHFPSHTQLLLLTPAFIFCAGVGREKCVLDFWRRPNNTKQKNNCILDETKPKVEQSENDRRTLLLIL